MVGFPRKIAFRKVTAFYFLRCFYLSLGSDHNKYANNVKNMVNYLFKRVSYKTSKHVIFVSLVMANRVDLSTSDLG